MSNSTTVEVNIGDQIKVKLWDLSQSDGLKRTQRWLASQTGLGEVELSNKIKNISKFSPEDLKKINSVIGTSF